MVAEDVAVECECSFYPVMNNVMKVKCGGEEDIEMNKRNLSTQEYKESCKNTKNTDMNTI